MGGILAHHQDLDVDDDVEETTAGEDQTKIDFTKTRDIDALVRMKRAETAKLATSNRNTTKENQQLLKKLFKRLDPTVAKVATETQGEIQMSLKYDPHKENLLVKVIKVRDLGLNSITGKSCSPYVVLTMFPYIEDTSTKQTGISQQSQNPMYNEIFSFPLDEIALMDHKLVVRVADFDVMGDDEFLGEVVIDLCDINFTQALVHTAWYLLQPEKDLTITGELEVSMSYSMPHNLTVNVHRVTNVRNVEPGKPLNAFVKVGIPGIENVELTKVVTDHGDASWDESFMFEVPVEEFALRYVVFTVLDEGETESDHVLLGHLVIDLDNFDGDTGFHGSLPLSDMSNSDRLKNKWFQSQTVQEFKEALWAHSYFQSPKYIFKNHSGNKIVRLTCKKAGAKGKLTLQNGIPVV